MFGESTYPCPDCLNSVLHSRDCGFRACEWEEIQLAYHYVLGHLSPGLVTESELRAAVSESSGEWSELHGSVLSRLEQQDRVVREYPGFLRLMSPAEYRDALTPKYEPLRTVYEHGSVKGCHDNAVFAMVAWCEMKDFSWEETKEWVAEWLRDSGAWERGGFEESSPEEVVRKKRHVYEKGYGWSEKAEAAKRVIEQELLVSE